MGITPQEKRRARYLANRDTVLAQTRAWKQANPEKVAEQRRRAREEGREPARFDTMPTNTQPAPTPALVTYMEVPSWI